MIKKVVGLHYSPWGRTAELTRDVSQGIAECLSSYCNFFIESACYDLSQKEENLSFDDETIVVIGMPSYIGNIPLDGLKAMRCLKGENTLTILLVSYGSRNYGNSLYELQYFSENQGFKAIGAAAFAASNRGIACNYHNNEAVFQFCDAASAKIKRLANCSVEGLKVNPVPLMLEGRLPKHSIVRKLPKVAECAQNIVERIWGNNRESEWYL